MYVFLRCLSRILYLLSGVFTMFIMLRNKTKHLSIDRRLRDLYYAMLWCLQCSGFLHHFYKSDLRMKVRNRRSKGDFVGIVFQIIEDFV